MAEGFRVTYATMSADNEELHKGYDEGIEEAKAELGRFHPAVVNGEERSGDGSYELSPESRAASNAVLAAKSGAQKSTPMGGSEDGSRPPPAVGKQ